MVWRVSAGAGSRAPACPGVRRERQRDDQRYVESAEALTAPLLSTAPAPPDSGGWRVHLHLDLVDAVIADWRPVPEQIIAPALLPHLPDGAVEIAVVDPGASAGLLREAVGVVVDLAGQPLRVDHVHT